LISGRILSAGFGSRLVQFGGAARVVVYLPSLVSDAKEILFMTLARSVFGLGPILFTIFLAAACAGTAAAQTTAPAPASPIVNSQGLQVEMVEAHNLVGIPAQITRTAGPFILAVTNRSADPTAWFVVDAVPAANSPTPAAATPVVAAAATATATAAHVLVIGSGLYDPKHRSAMLFAAVAGTYQLKYGASGKVLCTIVIQ
jgi:hypothetical protein